jgi:phage baseplate assembly protein W
MADGITYGINFPFQDSFTGRFLDTSDLTNEEIRSSLIHLLLTRKGTRYFLPDFGTRLYEYIFEPLDGPSFSDIESEIRDSVERYLPNLILTNISITDASTGEENKGSYVNTNGDLEYRVGDISQKEHTAKIKIEYKSTNDTFNGSDFVIINI